MVTASVDVLSVENEPKEIPTPVRVDFTTTNKEMEPNKHSEVAPGSSRRELTILTLAWPNPFLRWFFALSSCRDF